MIHHGKRHPAELRTDAVPAFLSSLANEHNVSGSTQNQAASALLFLYREVLGIRIEPPRGIVRPRKSARLPVVLTRDEVTAILDELSGTKRLVAMLPEAVRPDMMRQLARTQEQHERDLQRASQRTFSWLALR
ncbi:MAG: phage integrase N-terminal SAM-like domain-containing protein [Gemmatimonadetes bacterium]|nr:phage integrase N-terminal SAM-like domain-containing protein [Gemmatimonadota bacterium]